MDILIDRNVEPRYVNAIADVDRVDFLLAEDRFEDTTPDRELVRYAAGHRMVVWTRDNDFFDLVLGRKCGVIYHHPQDRTSPGTIAEAIARIIDVYPDATEIAEGLPGEWV